MIQKEDQHCEEGTRMMRMPIWTTGTCLDHVEEGMRRITVTTRESLGILVADLVARGEWLLNGVLNLGDQQVS